MTIVEVLDACSNHLGAHIFQDENGLWVWKVPSGVGMASGVGYTTREECEANLNRISVLENGNLSMKLGPDPGVDQV